MVFEKKEDKLNLVQKFKQLPKRKLSELEKQMIEILIEKSKIQRERSLAILNKGFLFFGAFMVISFLGQANGMINPKYINYLFFLGVAVLIVSTIYYQKVVDEEDQLLSEVLDSFLE